MNRLSEYEMTELTLWAKLRQSQLRLVRSNDNFKRAMVKLDESTARLKRMLEEEDA